MARPRSDIGPRIIHAARTRFLTEGVDGASLRRIADDAGTNIGMVYYYFPTKDDLFLAVVEEVYLSLLSDLERALAPTLPVQDRLRELYQRLGALSADELLVLRIVLREALASPARLARLIDRFQRGHLPLVVGLIRDGLATGLFNPDLSPALVMVAVMAIGGPAQTILQRLRPLLPLPSSALPTGPALSTALMQIVLTGVAPPAAAKTRAGRAKMKKGTPKGPS
jgi:TetR/AcrR family transcriptional regulator, regulator of autoinduction and epiphytic fitness